MIFPCFNPWGLINNVRLDAEGRDLNRLFHDPGLPLMDAWQKFIGDQKFRIALHLHEDYDARGLYIYELGREGLEIGDAILQECESVIPRETRIDIEGLEFDRGVIRREEEPDMPLQQETLSSGCWTST